MGDKDFFLSADDAQTMGDINYMRTSKRTRRTFPKTLKNPDGFAIENEVSSTEDRSGMYQSNTNQDIAMNSGFNPTPTVQSAPAPSDAPAPAPAPAPSPQTRRKSDSSMDMFRNMAKNIRR